MIASPTADSFTALLVEVAACRRCPRMEGRRRVLSPANGRLQPQVMFVAEAPGRLGADRTGIPMSGDQMGQRFRALLAISASPPAPLRTQRGG